MGRLREKAAKPEPVSARDIVGAALFLVGEGSFRFETNTVKKHEGRTLTVAATQAERRPLEKILELFGGTIYGPYKKSLSTRPLYIWHAHGGRAAGIMMTVYATVQDWSPKREREIRLALAAWRQRRVYLHPDFWRCGHSKSVDNTQRKRNKNGQVTARCRVCNRLRSRESHSRRRRRKPSPLSQVRLPGMA